MGRSKARKPRAQNAVAAAVERAIERGAERMVFVYVDLDGCRYCISTGEMDVAATAGLLSLTVADLAANGMDLPEDVLP